MKKSFFALMSVFYILNAQEFTEQNLSSVKTHFYTLNIEQKSYNSYRSENKALYKDFSLKFEKIRADFLKNLREPEKENQESFGAFLQEVYDDNLFARLQCLKSEGHQRGGLKPSAPIYTCEGSELSLKIFNKNTQALEDTLWIHHSSENPKFLYISPDKLLILGTTSNLYIYKITHPNKLTLFYKIIMPPNYYIRGIYKDMIYYGIDLEDEFFNHFENTSENTFVSNFLVLKINAKSISNHIFSYKKDLCSYQLIASMSKDMKYANGNSELDYKNQQNPSCKKGQEFYIYSIKALN